MSDTSEFICEIVEVTDVLPHPNADRLKIIKIRGKEGPMGYSLISGDHYEVGEHAVFVGVDSMVPVADPLWDYCKKRLDYKPGASHYRIRRAKLRGIPTDGVLVRSPGGKLGEDVSEKMGILKYELPESVDVVSVNTSDKGPPKSNNNWYKRHIPDYAVINLRKVANLFEEGELVEVSEKIHGSNIRFGKVKGKLYVGSHHAIKSDLRGFWRKLADRLFRRTQATSHWYGTDVWSTWVKENVDFSRLPEGYIFYGEIFGPGIQKGFEYGQTNHAVQIFDVWDVAKQTWCGDIGRAARLGEAGLNHVHYTYEYFSWPLIERLAMQESGYGGGLKEGVVVKSLCGTRRGKYVSDKYREMG